MTRTGGGNNVGGLVGDNSSGSITASYNTGTVTGGNSVGGLVGDNSSGSVTASYSTGSVTGGNLVGGLVGHNDYGSITTSFWDIETSGQAGSNGGVGLTTIEMKDPEMLALNGLAHDSNWVLHAGHDYPRLAWEGTFGQTIPDPVIDWLSGSGTPEAPFEISSVEQLILLSKASILADKYFVLCNHLDLSELTWNQAVIPYFDGTFDGNDYAISHLAIQGGGLLGLFGRLGSNAEVMSLGVEAVEINGTDGRVGGLVGQNDGSITSSYSAGSVSGGNSVGGLVGENGGSITTSYGTSSVSGANDVGGLAGYNWGTITTSRSTGTVIGEKNVGGLVGRSDPNTGITACWSTGTVTGDANVGGLVGVSNSWEFARSYSTATVIGVEAVGGLVGRNDSKGRITTSWSTGTVSGGTNVGGFAGENHNSVAASYSTVAVTGDGVVGGLVGLNANGSTLNHCYSAGSVSGRYYVGGLVGDNDGDVTGCFWDTDSSAQLMMCGSQGDEATGCDDSFGRTTAELRIARTFLDAGWDFANEKDNGGQDIWWILEGEDYSRLVCQLWASVPVPHNGAIVVSQSAILSWQGAPGTEAHDVYLGEDEQAVANATAQSTGIYRGRQQAHETTYAPEILKVDATYYWRIDEVNEIDPNSPHKGWIWSFTTGDSNVLVVDDFESYNNDSPNYPFQTWLDAWGYSADEFFPDGYEGNGTGGALGYDIWTWQAPYIMETEIVHGGEQSVPYYYDNSRWLYYSEVQRTFTRPSYCGEDRVETPQNWTVDDADTLILHFHGKPDNDPEPLYVAIEDSTGQIARVTHPGSDAVLATEWQQWQIPLADFQAQGVDVTSVRKMIIGLGNRDAPQPGGSGLIYIDDIWVTKRMP